MARPTKPRSSYQKRTNVKRFGQNVRVVARVVSGTFTLSSFLNDEDETDSEAPGTPELLIGIKKTRSTSFTNLCLLTTEELDVLEKFFAIAFEQARPIVALRDKRAQEAFENGINTFTRSYRQAPVFITFEGPQPNDPGGVRERSEAVPPVEPDDGDAGELQPTGDDVAQREPSTVGTQDDGAAIDNTENLGEVGEVAD